MSERIVKLVGGVRMESVAPVIEKLLKLDSESNEPILLKIASEGGDVYAGMALVEIMQSLKSPIVTMAVGLVASMGSIILSQGSPGFRTALPESRIMLHQARGFSLTKDYDAKDWENVKLKMASLLAAQANDSTKDQEYFVTLLGRDLWLDPDMAIEFGVIDRYA